MSEPTGNVILKSGRDKSVRNRHPRLFSGAIKEIIGHPKEGDVVDVTDNRGAWLARGIINQQAQIAVRLMTWNPAEGLDDALWSERIQQAISARARDPQLAGTNAQRLIFSESDGLPGLIADNYDGHIVVQISTLAASNMRGVTISALAAAAQPKVIYERADEERLKHERVSPGGGLVLGRQLEDNHPIEIHERNVHYLVNVIGGGQKTGFYLDQRTNRAAVARYAGRGGSMLNTFSYTGGFALHAAMLGAGRVVNIDSSADALDVAQQNFVLNQMLGNTHATEMEFVCADVFDDLRQRRDRGEQFDVVVLDPPKFAHNPSQVDRAARAYKDLNRLGLALVRPGGVLATFSCSGVIDALLFQKILFSASIEAQRDARIVERLTQASDHPVLLSFPESEYLKGLICRVS